MSVILIEKVLLLCDAQSQSLSINIIYLIKSRKIKLFSENNVYLSFHFST